MKIYDITHGVRSAPIYQGSRAVDITPISSMKDGDGCNMSIITAESHMGSHADAICHFVRDGNSIDEMDIDHYLGECQLIRVEPNCKVTPEMLEGKLFAGIERLVLACGSEGWLCEQTAHMFVQMGLRTVVTEGMSVGEFDNEAVVHRILLGGGVAIVENVCLEGVPEGKYMMSALPIKYEGCDGAPVRAVLWCEE